MRQPRKSPTLAAGSTALLVIDLLSEFRFEGAAALLRPALAAARRIAALRERTRKVAMPTIFVNDNLGRWRSDMGDIVRRCTRPGSPGAAIVHLLAPDARDYFVLKPLHSGFYGTPLERLLRHLHAKSVILTGISTHQCVLFTAMEAYLRDFGLVIPRDCVAAKTPRQQRLALEYLRTVLDARIGNSAGLRLVPGSGRPRRRPAVGQD